MRKNVYEVFEEFAKADSKQDKINVLANNWTPTVKLVLQLAYRPEMEWKFKDYPKRYKKPDTKPGISYATLDTELKRLYMFRVGNETAEKLTEKRAEEILMVLLESLEPLEADVVIGIFKKDLGVKGLTYKFIRDNIPDVL
jgi:hypothetical protein